MNPPNVWRTVIGAALLAAAAPAAAGGAAQKPDSGYAACMAKAVSTRDMQDCQRAALDAANVRLGAAYAKALAALPPDQQAKLREAERRWTAFRRADCEVFYGNETGTLATVNGGGCMIERTEERIKNLGSFGEP